MNKEVEAYKLFRQLEAREKRANPYKFYDKDELIDEILKNEDEIERLNNIINELEECIDNFDVFKEFSFPLMKRWEEEQVKSSIDYEWRKTIKEPFLNKIKELKGEDKE